MGAMSDSARSGGAGLGCTGSGVAGSIRRHEVGRVARGRTVSVGRAGMHGVGWLGARGSVDRLDVGPR
jgi:hypothetical protein